MNGRIRELASKHREDSFFTYVAPTDEMIEGAQRMLGVTLPASYIDYLKEYGHGGVGGVTILGVYFDGSMAFLEETLERRAHGLPDNLVIVENVDEWVYCIDCETGAVASWSEIDGMRHEFPSFEEFVISEFEDAIENL